MQNTAEILARREHEAERRSVNDAEASARRKAWCAKVGRAIGEEIDDIAEMEEDRQYGLRRFRQQEEALRRREESANTRTLREGLSKAEKATSRPTLPPQPRAFRNALPGCAFVARTLVEQEFSPKPWPQAFRNARPGFARDAVMRLDKEDTLEEEPAPKPQPVAFRYADRRAWTGYIHALRDIRRDYDTPVLRQEFVPQVDDDHLDDATFLTHQDWEQRIEEAESRRKERQQLVQHEEEHSTGLFDTVKSWATGLWKKVKETFWG